MDFNTYDQFKDAVSSEKLSLILVYPRQGVTTFADQGGNIWKRSVNHVVHKLFTGSTELAVQTSSAVDASNPWYYDISTSELWYYTTSTLPDDDNLIAEYVLHYSNAPINMSHDLGDSSPEVEYEPRVLTTVGFKSEIGSDQKGISVTGSGTVSLQNNDGHFDSLFDAFIWENKRVEIYSYNRGLLPSQAQLQYKGFIVNKSFNTDKVSFKIQDAIFKLDTKVSMNLFTALDGVGPAYVGQPKRQIYGKVDGVLCRSMDQVGEGYSLTGTVSSYTLSSNIITGKYTNFSGELSVGNVIRISNIDYTIVSVISNTEIEILGTIQKTFDRADLKKPFDETKTGTISGTAGSNVITGSTTIFNSELSENDIFNIGSSGFIVDFIESDTILYLKDNVDSSFSTQPFTTEEEETLTGYIYGNSPLDLIIGTDTVFLTELAQNDSINIEGTTYAVKHVNSDTELTVQEDRLETSFTNKTFTSIPAVNSPEFNRTMLVADHPVKQSTSTITEMDEFNRLRVVDIEGFEVDDQIAIEGDKYRITQISANLIKLSINAVNKYAIGTIVTKEPFSNIYNNGTRLASTALLSYQNETGLSCTFTLTKSAEFDITKDSLIDGNNFFFESGSRVVIYSGTADINTIIKERDWITKEGENEYIRVVDIVGNKIRCNEVYTGITQGSVRCNIRRPEYIGDDSNVSTNVVGKTAGATPTGKALSTGPDIIKDLLIDAELGDSLDTDSFTQANLDSSHRMSLTIPYLISDTPPKIKEIINDINQSIFGALSLTQDFKLAYNINTADRVDDIRLISDDDIISWKMKGKSTNSYKEILGKYNFKDFDNISKDENNSVVSYASELAENFNVSNKEIERIFRVYSEADAQELVERYLHIYIQTLTELEITSDLRLSDINVGDKVRVNFKRFIKSNIGDSHRVFVVVGFQKNGSSTLVKLSDFGNLYNRSAVISKEDAQDFGDLQATITAGDAPDSTPEEIEAARVAREELRYNSYIVDDNDLITGYDQSKGTNLIS